MAIDSAKFSISAGGDLRQAAAFIPGTDTPYTILELHEWLQDLADNATASGDDNVSILGSNPSEIAGKRNAARPTAVTLLPNVNVNDATAQWFKFGSIEQASGDDLYTGVKTIGTIPADASMYVVQDNVKANSGTKWWPLGPIQTLVKCKSGGALIDSGNITVFAREFGRKYSHFDLNLSAGSEQLAALAISTDANVTMTAGDCATAWAAGDVAVTFYGGATSHTLGGVTKDYWGKITLANGCTIAEAYQILQWATREATTETFNTVPGWRYRKLRTGYAEVQEAPFGAFAGGKWFLAQGWWIEGFLAGDSQAFQLIADDGTIVTPPNQIGITVGNLVVGDRVLAGKDDGAGGFVTTTGLTATGSAAATTVTLSGAAATDVPTANGYIRIGGNAHSYTAISGTTVSGLSPAVPGGGYPGAAVWFPYVDTQADATSESSGTFNFGSAFTLRVRVRNGSGAGAIVPFETTASISGASATINAVRTADV